MCGSWMVRARLERSTTGTQARAPSTRQTYALRCSGRPVPGKAWSHREAPEVCQEDESLQATPCALFGPLYRPAGLQRGPFEPLDSVELKFLSLKTALLTALTSIKRVGDLQAFSVSEECLVFGPAYSHVVLRPRPGYVPKVPAMPFRDQVVNLQALPSEKADPALALLCPVRALRIYVNCTWSFKSSEQLLTPNTFARFYSLCVEPVSSRVLSNR